MSYERLVSTIKGSFYESIIVIALLTIAFLMFEPMVGRAVTDEFLVTQVISAGIAFEAATGDVTMVGSIDGLTGGTSYGSTTARVTTNNGTGYNMTIQFSSTTAMSKNGTVESRIKNFQYSTGTAVYPTGFNANGSISQFGFSVLASTTADVSDVFTGSAPGADCGTVDNTLYTQGDCWRGASSTDATSETELINTSGATEASGSTSTIMFQIVVPNAPSPAVPDGTYTATATLTAIVNP